MLLLRELLARRERLVPAAQHEEGVRSLRQHRPFAGSIPKLAGEGEGLVEISQCIAVLVALEAPVGEPEVADASFLHDVVVECDLEGVLE